MALTTHGATAARAAREAIDRRFAEPLRVSAIADEVGYSRFHLARAFRAVYGRSPRTHLSQRRIERAQELLRCSDLTVTEVCFTVGFSSLGSFSAAFKRTMGFTPSAYRQHSGQQEGTPVVPACVLLMRAVIGDERSTSGEAGPDERP